MATRVPALIQLSDPRVAAQLVEYYKQNSSPVCICYLDATKAFDRVNHWLPFKKLLDRNMPLHIVRLLVCWYRTQRFNVQWGGCSSKGFSAANGVPQGGILSPWLFNIYIADMSPFPTPMPAVNLAGCLLIIFLMLMIWPSLVPRHPGYRNC